MMMQKKDQSFLTSLTSRGSSAGQPIPMAGFHTTVQRITLPFSQTRNKICNL